MYCNLRPELDDIPNAQLIISEAQSRVSSVVEDILTPVSVLPEDTNGLDFASVLELLGDAYNKKLCTLRRAEEQALSNFHATYRNYIRQKDVIKSDIPARLNEQANLNVTCVNEQVTDDFNENWPETNSNLSVDKVDEGLYLSCTPYKELSSLYPEIFHHGDESRELWQKKVTVPEPFQMTLREEEKQYKSRSKRKNCKHSDSKEAPVTFHGNPVPAHVHLPIFKLITEKSEKLRQDRIDTRKHRILAEVKPFHLSFENSTKPFVLRRSQSLSNLSLGGNFRAAPFPQHIFEEPTQNEKRFLENLRKIRIKSRADELMKMSSLPFTGQKILNRCNSFGTLNRKDICKQDRLNYSHTVKQECKMFGGTQDVVLTKSKLRHKSCIPNTQLLFKPSPAKPFSPNCETGRTFHCKLTKTAILRQEKCRREQEKASQMKVNQLAEQSNRNFTQNRLQREVALKVKMNCHIPSTQESIRAKLIANRKSQNNRLEEYSREIQEMNNRIQKRPLLIEQQVQQAARNAAAKKFQAGVPLTPWVVPKSRKNSSGEDTLQDPQSIQENNSDAEPEYYSNDEFGNEEHSEAELSRSLDS